MIGQTEILKKLNTYSLDLFPHALMLVGEEGMGKHTLCQYIANKFRLNLLDITDSLNFNNLLDYYCISSPTLYVVDTNKLLENQKNSLLKLLEDPPEIGFFVLLSESDNLIDTLKARCQIWYLADYSEDELLKFTTNKDLLKYISIPGQLKALNNISLSVYIDLATKLIDKISYASYSNILSISNKFAWNGEEQKLNFKVFIKVLKKISFEKYLTSSDTRYYQIFQLTLKLSDDLGIVRINKIQLFDHYLMQVKELFNEYRGN